MAKKIIIQLWPPQGGGVQSINTPQGPVPVPVPAATFNGVVSFDLVVNTNSFGVVLDRYLKFTTRTGDEIVTNLHYTIVTSHDPEGEA